MDRSFTWCWHHLPTAHQQQQIEGKGKREKKGVEGNIETMEPKRESKQPLSWNNPRSWNFIFNTCNFCCIYFQNNKNLECRHTPIKRCYTQDLHISFQYVVEKVLIWKLFLLLVESPFAGWIFPLKRFIEKVSVPSPYTVFTHGFSFFSQYVWHFFMFFTLADWNLEGPTPVSF